MNIKTKLYTLLTVILIIATGCNNELDKNTTLTFIGDSIIARWDLQSSFSSLITYNKGVSGSGIDYIESIADEMTDKNIVVMTGTNDKSVIREDNSRKEYAQRYVSALMALNAKKIYLYEVLPREFNGDDNALNEHIRSFNTEIRQLIMDNPQIIYIPVFDYFLRKDGHIAEEYYNDGLHLSPQGYEILSGALFKKLK